MPDAAYDPVKVLLVEDDVELCSSIAESLSLAGYEVVAAISAEAAIAESVDRAKDVDIVVTDVVLPEMSGVELVSVLWRRRPGLEVLFMSGYTEEILREHGLASAEARFLGKPFTLEQLEEKMREYLPGCPARGGGCRDAGTRGAR